MDDRILWRVRGLQLVTVALLAACGGGGGGSSSGTTSAPAVMTAAQPVAQDISCQITRADVFVEAIRIRPAANEPETSIELPAPRSIDLLDPGAGVLEALQVAPLTHDAADVRLRVASGSTVQLEDGTVAPLRVPGQLRLTGDFRLAAGMVADLVVQGLDRCNAFHAAGGSGQFVLNGDVPTMVRALPFVTDREQTTDGMLRPVPGNGYATVSSPAMNNFAVQRFDAYGNALGNPTQVSLDGSASASNVTPLSGGQVLAIWLGPATDPERPLAQHFPLMVQRFAADGSSLGAPMQVALTQPFSSRITPPELPQAAALADGGAALVWVQIEGDNHNVYLQRFAADGSTAGDPQRATDSGPGGMPNVIELAGHRILVAWGTGPLFARVFEADGTTDAQQAIAPTAVSLFGPPQLAALADGGAAVAWTTAIDQRFPIATMLRLGPDGAAIGTPQLLADGSMPGIAGLTDGGFIMAWALDTVSGRRFGADGTPLGPFAQISQETTRATQTSVVSLPWGGFLVGWQGTADGTVHNVMRFFDAQGLLGG